jgi:hypothetical protein
VIAAHAGSGGSDPAYLWVWAVGLTILVAGAVIRRLGTDLVARRRARELKWLDENFGHEFRSLVSYVVESSDNEKADPADRLVQLIATEPELTEDRKVQDIQIEIRLAAVEKRLDSEFVTEQRVIVIVIAALVSLSILFGFMLAIVDFVAHTLSKS